MAVATVGSPTMCLIHTGAGYFLQVWVRAQSATRPGGSTNCPNTQAPYLQWNQYNNWKWTDPRGTVHTFPGIYTLKYSSPVGGNHCTTIPTDNPTGVGDAIASDGSGYVLTISNYSTAKITDTQGTSYYPTTSGSTPGTVQAVDSNGNYWTTDSNGNLVDDRGQTPVLTTTSRSTIYYDVLSVGGGRQRYTVTLEAVPYNTAFQQTAVTDVSGSFNAIKEIDLPDGSSYAFSYDSYGELDSMTLPTGG
jgi:YD repeat-containing protein